MAEQVIQAEPQAQDGSCTQDRLEDLAQIIRAYNDATEKLQASHESLRGQVVRLQSELASTNAKLQRSKRLAALGEMAAGIAHEIRNPLAAIQLYAGIMEQDLAAPEGGDGHPGLLPTAKKIGAAVRGLDAIVNDVLTFSRELTVKPTAVGVEYLFDRAVETCGPAITAAGVRVVRLDNGEEHDGEQLAMVDPGLMHQALVNLIRNAVDAMSEPARHGQEPRRVSALTLGARREGPHVALTVRDTGPGIAEADIDRIFNPFFTTRNSGTGLGLAIVHRIVDSHGGTVSVHNDGGAVFELMLPGVANKSVERGDRLERVGVSAGQGLR